MYVIFSIDSHPQLLYKLPQRNKSEKIEDALQCSSPLVSEPPTLVMITASILKCFAVCTMTFTLHVLPQQEKSLSTPFDQKPCLVTLTANNWLYRLSAETGEKLQGVYLSPNPKFK